MPSTFSQNLRIELIGAGEQVGVWGNTTNNNLGDLIEAAISGATNLDVTLGDITLTALNGVPDQARSAVLAITGTPGTTRVITIPNVQKPYTVKNRSNATVQIKTAAGTAFNVPTLSEAYVYCDGNNVITGRVITDGAEAFNSNPTPLNNLALTGVPTAPTAPVSTNTTQIATTAYTVSRIAQDAPTKTGGGASGTWAINISGNAATATNATNATNATLAASATALQNARLINGTSFNGTANITTANWGTARNISIGGTTKSVNGGSDVTWATSEIAAQTAVTLATPRAINGTNFNGSANITTATWGTTRTISIGGTAKSVNGGSNVTWATSEIAAQSAVQLATARLIGGVSFNGTANINLPGVNIAGNQSTSGNAATATALQTARAINGTNFNGTSAITTANWGTARTISIGGTAKSVNGSGNVTWTTGEIAAQSAVQLATARAINGTNFNGTSNITTATWGTARNVTIGNTTRSVNGSGNVSWSLAEIGAADRTLNIATGSGLVGGGNLTASRTLSVDSSVIRTTGNQTLTGQKTFTDPVIDANGIRYPGAAVFTGRGSNRIGFTFGSSEIVGSVDNATQAVVGTTSDYRLKTNVQDITDGLAVIKQLRPISYDMVGASPDSERDYGKIGFLAHEVQSVIPSMVLGKKDAVTEDGSPVYQSVNYAVLVSVLTAAIQEQQKQIDALFKLLAHKE